MSGEITMTEAIRAVDEAHIRGHVEAYRYAAMFVRGAQEQTHHEIADVLDECANRLLRSTT